MSVELLSGQKDRGESSKAIQACNDYLRLGPGRSLRNLYSEYIKAHQNTSPTKSLNTLLRWSSGHGWQSRAALYDARLEVLKTAEHDAIMNSGLALCHNRVRELMEIYEELRDKLTRSMERKGATAEVADVAVGALLRGLLDDIAKETGGRIQKLQNEHSGKNGGPIEFTTLTNAERVRRVQALLGLKDE